MANPVIYFSSISADNRLNLWVSDGTTAGTVPVSTGPVGAGGLAPSHFAVLAGRPYFQGFDGDTRPSLYTVIGGVATRITSPAGSPAGLAPGLGSAQAGPVAFAGKLFFQGRDQNGVTGLFVSDGTDGGTVPFPVPGVSGASTVGHLARFGNRLAFGLESSVSATGLYVSDGTPAGTTRLAVLGAPFSGLTITSMAGAGSTLVFAGATSGGKTALWSSDGTGANTRDIIAAGLNFNERHTGDPVGLVSFGAKAAFTANDPFGRSGVWVTDGTGAGTLQLPGVTGSSDGVPMAAMPDGRLAFIARNTSGVSAVFVTDGETVTELQVPGTNPATLAPRAVMVLGMRLLFDGVTAGGGRVLFASDGTGAGTTVLRTGVALSPFVIATDAAVIGPGPTLLVGAAPPPLHAGETAVLARAVPGIDGDTLIATILSPGLPDGSTLTVDAQGQVIFRSGVVRSAEAGVATLRYQVTDSLTGQTVDGSAEIPLLMPGQRVGTDPLFDLVHYLRTYPDVARAGADPAQHYDRFGWQENRNPSALFDTRYYEARNPDVAAARVNPLQHYGLTGWREGRDPSAAFDTRNYLAANPDVRAAEVNPLAHYMVSGRAEGRAAFTVSGVARDPLVDAAFVYASRADVRAAGVDATAWFGEYGWREGADPDRLFDVRWYLARNPDVAAAHVNPLLHYEVSGWREGRDPSATFSSRGYLAGNPDVAAAGVNPLLHYVVNGQAEGRAIYPV